MTVDEALELIREAGESGETKLVLSAPLELGYWERHDELLDACAEHGVDVYDGTWTYDGRPRRIFKQPGDPYWFAYDRAAWLLMLGIYPTPTISEELRRRIKPKSRHRRYPGFQNGEEAAGRRRALREAGYQLDENTNYFFHPNLLRPQPRRPLG